VVPTPCRALGAAGGSRRGVLGPLLAAAAVRRFMGTPPMPPPGCRRGRVPGMGCVCGHRGCVPTVANGAAKHAERLRYRSSPTLEPTPPRPLSDAASRSSARLIARVPPGEGGRPPRTTEAWPRISGDRFPATNPRRDAVWGPPRCGVAGERGAPDRDRCTTLKVAASSRRSADDCCGLRAPLRTAPGASRGDVARFQQR